MSMGIDTLSSAYILVQPRKTRSDITEDLLTGTYGIKTKIIADKT